MNLKIHKIKLRDAINKKDYSYLAPSNIIETDQDLVYYKEPPFINIMYGVSNYQYADVNDSYSIFYPKTDTDDSCYMNIIGTFHRTNGYAIVDLEQPNDTFLNQYYLNGEPFYSKEEWFYALTSQEKEEYIWTFNND